MDALARYRHGVDRAGQTLAEWWCGKLQWQIPRRVLEPRMVPQQSRGEGDHRAVATSLQRRTPSFEPRPFDTGRVRSGIEGASRTVRAGNGSERIIDPRTYEVIDVIDPAYWNGPGRPQVAGLHLSAHQIASFEKASRRISRMLASICGSRSAQRYARRSAA